VEFGMGPGIGMNMVGVVYLVGPLFSVSFGLQTE